VGTEIISVELVSTVLVGLQELASSWESRIIILGRIIMLVLLVVVVGVFVVLVFWWDVLLFCPCHPHYLTTK